ncbi:MULTISPECIES: 50S ribosomal protein L18Ae [unclassified Haladaptatus]|uniref:50S ribosomal protein L18Ae n=1 Tax=unclassified Haladaptatus TaxID=2622732 RepID=UPI002FCE3D37
MSQFTVTGQFKTSRGWESYTKTIDAPNENVAEERIYTQFGSKHGLNRAKITIDSVEEAEEVAA